MTVYSVRKREVTETGTQDRPGNEARSGGRGLKMCEGMKVNYKLVSGGKKQVLT